MTITAVPLRPIAKGSVLKLWIVVALMAVAAVALAWVGTAGQVWSRTASGLQYQVVKEGQGPHPTSSDVALLDYAGMLPDGTVFDTTKGQQPRPFPLAPDATIKGFSEGIQLMRKGATYRFRIPPALAYGAAGRPPAIPPNATLVFEVTLLEFLPEAQVRAMMLQQQMQQQMMQQQGGAGAPGGAPGAQGAPAAPAGPGQTPVP
jgi:FKBP-type peptidyl-prolyl cis-trans isomerase FkpA